MNRSSGKKQAIVVGSGPNGLAAAIELAQAGYAVTVREAASAVGGGARSEEVTLPGFIHDICSTVHPLGVASPFFRRLRLEEHGLEWIYPPAAVAHPFDDGTAALLEKSIGETGETFGNASDAAAYRKLIQPLVYDWEKLLPDLLGPLRVPRHPVAYARFGLSAMRSAEGLVKSRFEGERARAIFAGIAAHAMLPLDRLFTASFGLILGVAGHVDGWAIARGGSQKIADALVSHLRSSGGEIITGATVESLDDLLTLDSVVLCDLTPRGLLRVAGNRLPESYRRKLERFRYGSAAFKIDWALSQPIPWRAKECLRSATVHLGCTLEEIMIAEAAAENGMHAEKPFVLVAQQSLFDSTRAPEGKHTAWAYCHVPNNSTFDMTERIENQIERFAPGFRDCILARNVMPPAALERHNANLVGGNISGGATDLSQLFLRPTRRLYRTPTSGLYICSSSTPPGGGVHGMCGYYAARAVLKDAR
ncbi:MAG: NAD(P)/FAD-dependent oxidoreductase [Acidobacteriota bacterium]|nr:NAD(P)/FAD-dependent oxidoreductase [Acidobacteriota bacterium]